MIVTNRPVDGVQFWKSDDLVKAAGHLSALQQVTLPGEFYHFCVEKVPLGKQAIFSLYSEAGYIGYRLCDYVSLKELRPYTPLDYASFGQVYYINVSSGVRTISAWNLGGVWLSLGSPKQQYVSYDELLAEYVHTDGSPCGMLS